METPTTRLRSRASARHYLGMSAAILSGSLIAPRAASAHDYWMVPDPLVTPGPHQVDLSLFVGEGFVAEEKKPYQRGRTTRFVHVRGGAAADLMASAVEGAAPLVRLRVAEPGGHLFVLDRNIAKIELAAAKFEDYLRHEGLEDVIAERERRGESSKLGRERYTRHLKALVQVGDARDDTFAKVMGQPLELVPESNPAFTAPGERLAFRVQFRGAPLAKARVEAFWRAGADIKGVTLTTDARGIVDIPIDRRGAWLVRMVHMVRCDGCADADWESMWASYVFASRPPDGGTVNAPLALGPSKSLANTDKTTRNVAIGAAILAALASIGAFFFLRRQRRSLAS